MAQTLNTFSTFCFHYREIYIYIYTVCCICCWCVPLPALLQTLGTACASITHCLKPPFLACILTLAAASLSNHTNEMSACQRKEKNKKKHPFSPHTHTVNSPPSRLSISALCLSCNADILKGWSNAGPLLWSRSSKWLEEGLRASLWLTNVQV